MSRDKDHLQFQFGVFKKDSPEARYMLACARIRKISLASLCKRMILVICQDQLVGSILDDEGRTTRGKGEQGYSKRRRRRDPDQTADAAGGSDTRA